MVEYRDKFRLTEEGKKVGEKVLEKNPWFKKRVEECLEKYDIEDKPASKSYKR